ncbi:MAG: ADOP family duplicated permease [Bryobacteraceae bacterium]|nr:ADOP family duplicated permease [Bryobacteraceae bacterium]
MSSQEEFESHIAMRAALNEQAGMDPVEARRAAERAFGNRGQIGEAVRAVSVPVWLEQAGQDLRYAARGLARTPGFTLAALAALMIGIGTSTAVFSFADRVLFRALPYAQEHELVWFGVTGPLSGGTEFILEQNYAAWRKQPTPFSGIAVSSGVNDCNLSELNPVQLRCADVSANWLSLFGYHPLAGRDFRPEDATVGAPRMALISRSLWRTRFGGGNVSGRVLVVDGNRLIVAGVLPEHFELPSLARVDILRVLQLEENKAASAPTLLLTAFGRLRPGVTLENGRAQMEPFFREGVRTSLLSTVKDVRFVIHPLRDRQVRDSKQAMLLLLAAVALVLAIAVANVANLTLARATARQRELSVRAALGASKARLARQALTESLVLGLLSGAAGLVLAAGLLALFRALAPEGILRLSEASIDWRIAGFALLVTAGSSILAGLTPALKTPSSETLTGARVAGRRQEWLRPSLVVLQVALSLTLLCGAALFLQSLRNMANAPLGMETSSLLSVYARVPEARYPHPAQRASFWRSVMERLKSTPGVAAIGMADSLPPQGRTQSRVASSISVPGRPKPTGPAAMQSGRVSGGVVVRHVSPSYFPMLAIPLRQGRVFTEGEDRAIILSERMAARMFPGENAVGQHLTLAGEGDFAITAVVGDVRNGGLVANSDPEIYRASSGERPGQYILLRADSRVVPFVREAFRTLDPRLTLQFQTLDERVREMRARPGFQSMLLSGFAVAGLGLAAIGLYGVMALLTLQRTGEIAIRMALGATASGVQRMVLRQAGAWTLAGAALGIGGVAAGGQLIEGLLYGVRATAPEPLALAIGTLMLAALLAAWIPARRASHVDPARALREL